MTHQQTGALRVLLTGATGMVGEGVLHECLQNRLVEKVLVINRRPCGILHPKLTEIIHTDFYHWDSVEDKLTGYNTCFFCLGVSSIGMKAPEYTKLTYTLTMQFAQTFAKKNPGTTFCYISGAGTDGTEHGRSMWARVKGKTENDLAKLPFKKVYNFRPGALKATKGLKNTLSYYKYISWLFPLVELVAPNAISSLQELGTAMINATVNEYPKSIIEVKDIHTLAKASSQQSL